MLQHFHLIRLTLQSPAYWQLQAAADACALGTTKLSRRSPSFSIFVSMFFSLPYMFDSETDIAPPQRCFLGCKFLTVGTVHNVVQA